MKLESEKIQVTIRETSDGHIIVRTPTDHYRSEFLTRGGEIITGEDDTHEDDTIPKHYYRWALPASKSVLAFLLKEYGWTFGLEATKVTKILT